MSVFGNRRKKLLALAKTKQVVATKPSNIFYLADFWGGGAIVVQPDRAILVTSALESHRAEEVGKEVEVVVVKRWADVPLAIGRITKKATVITDDDSPFGKLRRFKRDEKTFLEARKVKDEVEIERIRRASEGQDRIFEMLEHEIKPGRTEWEIAAKVMEAALSQKLTQSSSDSALSPVIIASGENGALPHSELTDRTVRDGDFVVADIFLRSDGYHSDETRTFAVGSISAEMKSNYEAVFESQAAGVREARSGARCESVDGASRRELRERGVEKFLNHSIGHGVGIDIHELPSISKGNKTRLETNDIVTVEPGVYLSGEYGIRIEDTIRIGAQSEPLTHYTKELVTVG
ncbi:MAG: aminopeptidase P family protein [Nitrososphaerota archaeon]|nr:aminopeptidase P family protein [Nitrososphaerota archaeon]